MRIITSWISTAAVLLSLLLLLVPHQGVNAADQQKIFLVRHGERIDKVDDTWATKSLRPQDPPLTVKGTNMAFSLGHHLVHRHLEKNSGTTNTANELNSGPLLDLSEERAVRRPVVFFSSPMQRCIQTAESIARGLGLVENGVDFEIRVEESLVEGRYWVNQCLTDAKTLEQLRTLDHLPLWHNSTYHKRHTSEYVHDYAQGETEEEVEMCGSEKQEPQQGGGGEEEEQCGAPPAKTQGEEVPSPYWLPIELEGNREGIMKEKSRHDTWERCKVAAEVLFGSRTNTLKTKKGENPARDRNLWLARNTPIVFLISHGEATAAWSSGLTRTYVPDTCPLTGFTEFVRPMGGPGDDEKDVLPLSYIGEAFQRPHMDKPLLETPDAEEGDW